ncbi:MAG: hypothetical protein ACRDGL_00520 [Candidatus Limnocylindrales bacterium]
MAELRTDPDWWAGAPPAQAPTLDELIAAGTLDAELAALILWLLEAEVPIVVSGPTGAGATTVLSAILDRLPPEARTRRAGGPDEDFAWLPQASELGWPGRGGPLPPAGREAAWPGARLLLAELSERPGIGTWGLAARVTVRALQLGYSLATTAAAASLHDLLAQLQAPPVALTEDELRRLGLVLMVREVGPGRHRIVAAHYLRPLERYGQGHLQRQPPAVLATWDPATDRFEHFAWGVLPELGARFGRQSGAVERELADRIRLLGPPGPPSGAGDRPAASGPPSGPSGPDHFAA